MRFDDSLATVLAADIASGFGAQSAWRQLVDLVARRRVPDEGDAMARLHALRARVPDPVRAASGRALAGGDPPAALVALFTQEALAVSAPVLRTARLSGAEWLMLLPALTPAQRGVLRHRRDLPDDAVRGLKSLGATDLVLPPGTMAADSEPPEPATILPVEATAPQPIPSPPLSPTPFVAVGEVARALPVVAEAIRRTQEPSRFEIADLVARIDAFQRDRPADPAPAPPARSSGSAS